MVHARNFGFAPGGQTGDGQRRGGAANQARRTTGEAGTRMVLFSGNDRPVPTRIFKSRQGLTGAEGPLIVEEYDSTIIVPPGWSATTTVQGAVELRKPTRP